MNDDHPAGGSPDLVPAYLSQLREETMSRAWGVEVSPEDRRRIVVAATIFGRQLEERLAQRSPEVGGEELQRFLMTLRVRSDTKGVDLQVKSNRVTRCDPVLTPK